MKKLLTKQIVSVLSSYGARKISLFGSHARGDERKDSDIDLIVKFDAPKSLLELVRIENDLAQKTGKKIDLLTDKSISPYIAKRITDEVKVLYA
jgi:predicted nucleotidyltransferase